MKHVLTIYFPLSSEEIYTTDDGRATVRENYYRTHKVTVKTLPRGSIDKFLKLDERTAFFPFLYSEYGEQLRRQKEKGL